MPKPGLYKGGLLKSLTTWAIPLSFLPDNHLGCLFLSASFCPSSPRFVALPNTYLTPTRCSPCRRGSVPQLRFKRAVAGVLVQNYKKI